MANEFDTPEQQTQFSSFWPTLVVVVALIIFFGLQDYELNRQRGVYDKQLQSAVEPINKGKYYADRYVSLMKDLAETSQKNAVAAQIIRDAYQAGWIQVNQNGANTNSAAAPAAPSSSSTTSPK